MRSIAISVAHGLHGQPRSARSAETLTASIPALSPQQRFVSARSRAPERTTTALGLPMLIGVANRAHPYAPSWMDRLHAWIDTLPVAAWVAYLVVFLTGRADGSRRQQRSVVPECGSAGAPGRPRATNWVRRKIRSAGTRHETLASQLADDLVRCRSLRGGVSRSQRSRRSARPH
jgi:hypothetical protein